MNQPEFLEADAVLFMHDHAIREWGGHATCNNNS